MTTLVKRLLRAGTNCPVTGRKLPAHAGTATSRPARGGRAEPDAHATDWTSSVLSYENFR